MALDDQIVPEDEFTDIVPVQEFAEPVRPEDSDQRSTELAPKTSSPKSSPDSAPEESSPADLPAGLEESSPADLPGLDEVPSSSSFSSASCASNRSARRPLSKHPTIPLTH